MKPKVRLMKIRLIGHPEDVERSASSLKQTGSVVSDSANYPTKTQEVRRYLEVVINASPPVNS